MHKNNETLICTFAATLCIMNINFPTCISIKSFTAIQHPS